jgi:phenylacetate-coenzyme A ligase PaaK-like adenylate-forming protein
MIRIDDRSYDDPVRVRGIHVHPDTVRAEIHRWEGISSFRYRVWEVDGRDQASLICEVTPGFRNKGLLALELLHTLPEVHGVPLDTVHFVAPDTLPYASTAIVDERRYAERRDERGVVEVRQVTDNSPRTHVAGPT